jgi:hypothetical protein
MTDGGGTCQYVLDPTDGRTWGGDEDDRLFRTWLLRIEPWDQSRLSVERGRIHGLLLTSTVVIEYAERYR